MGDGGGGDITTTTYFYYKVNLPSKGILRTEPIYLYDATGTLIYIVPPNDSRVDYENGTWEVPGILQNTTIERISTASFWINYSDSKLAIDYDNILFKIDKSLILDVTNNSITADFEYATALAPIYSGRNMFDGRWDTQTQVVFYSKPPIGYAFAEIDLGQEYVIQGIDIIHGFFKPDEKLTFDINNKYSLEYSTDGTNYYPICREATNFNLTGGASISFERDKLGDDFSVRYFKLIVNDMEKIDYKNGCWVVAFTEFAAFQEVILKGEAKLIPHTYLSSAYISGTTLNVDSTSGFSSSGTAYLEDGTAFTYTALGSSSGLGEQLLKNSNFESWSSGTSVAPDNWVLSGTDATITQSTSIIKVGSYAVALTRAGTNATLTQTISTTYGITYWIGKQVTLSCWVYAAVVGTRICIADDDYTFSEYHSGTPGWELLTVTRTIGASASTVSVILQMTVDDTSYFDEAILIEGTSASLVQNGDFEMWPLEDAIAPDRWERNDGSGARESTITKFGSYSLKLTRSGSGAYYYQSIHDNQGIAYWLGRTISFSCWVYTDVVGIRIGIIDDENTFSSYHSGVPGWEWLTVTRTIGATATEVKVILQLTVDATAYFDGAKAVEGAVAIPFAEQVTSTTTFLGCTGLVPAAIDTTVSQTLESSTSVYDNFSLLPTIGDKLFKNTELNTFLDTQVLVNKRAKDYLIEFNKDHSKATVSSTYAPHIRVGQTIKIIDSTNNINKNYFVESIRGTDKGTDLTIAYYP